MSDTDEDLLTCEFCGELIRRPRKRRKKPFDCPVCGKAIPPPASAQPPPAKPVAPIPAEPEIAGTHEDDNNPYGLTGPRRFLCPKCQGELATDAVVCVRCGLNLSTGQRADRTYEPMRRQWTTGLPFAVRLAIFVVAQIAFMTLTVVVWQEGNDPVVVLGAWLGFAVLTAFLLGTYDRTDLMRNRRGLVKVTKSWHFAFVPMHPYAIRLEDYGTVSTAIEYEGSALDWIIFGILCVFGVGLGGILWWYFHLCQDVCFVRLHNGESKTLYRGRSHEVMRDIEETLKNVGGLRAG